MSDHPLRPDSRRSLGRPLPHQQADSPQAYPEANIVYSLTFQYYAVLATVSHGYPPLQGRFLRITHPFATRLSGASSLILTVRLACLRPAASVRSEPGSNSPLSKSLYTEISVINPSKDIFCEVLQTPAKP